MAPITNHRFFSSLRVAIISIGVLLLTIWCLRNSIALRNVLLAFGALIGILIITNKTLRDPNNYLQNRVGASEVRVLSLAPVIFAVMFFGWVIIHFVFFSSEVSLQLQELKGTWLRTVLALITGSAIGLVTGNSVRTPNFLWMGIYCSFIYLLFDYLFALRGSQSLFMAEYYFSSPFGNKINSVLMGGLFIGAACGSSAYAIEYLEKQPRALHIFWLSGSALVLFAYTKIIDTRNGIGLALILISAWLTYIAFKKIKKMNFFQAICAILVPILVLGFFIQEHLAHNKGWNHFLEDVEVGLQIDQIPNWQDIKGLGYPNTLAGEPVYPNNYERTAWAAAGVKSLLQNPLGFGLLEHSLGYLIKHQYPKATVMSSHSGWIDFGLAFGIPGLTLILGSLASIIFLALKSNSVNSLPIIWIAASLLLTFTVAETSSKHSIEILFFFIGLLTLLQSHKHSK